MYNLLGLVLPEGEEDLKALSEVDDTVPASGKNTPKIMSLAILSPVEEEEEDIRPGDLTKQREEQKKRDLYDEARELLSYYNRQLLMALIKCTKHTLETIKRRVTSPSAIQYGDSSEDKKKLDHRPAIKVKLVLAIPHIGLRPALDELQASLNTTVQNVLAVHKGIFLWGQGPEPQQFLEAVSGVLATPSLGPGALSASSGTFVKQKSQQDSRTFYKAVSEHKDVAKIVSMMTSTFSSAKALVTQYTDQFKHYEELWVVNRDEYMTKFMEEEPDLSEFDAKMKEYTVLDDVVAEEEDLLNCGSLALVTG